MHMLKCNTGPPHFSAPPLGPGVSAGTPGQLPGPLPFPFRPPPGAALQPLPLPLPQHLQQLQQLPPPNAHMQLPLPVPGNGPGLGPGVGLNPGGGLPYAQPYRSIAPSLFSSSSTLTPSIDPNTRPPIQGQGQGYPPSSSTVIAAAPTSYGYNPPSNMPGTVSYSAPPSSFSAYALPSLTPGAAASTTVNHLSSTHPVPVPQNQNTPALGDVTLVWSDEEYSMVRFI